jgi:ATP-dependent DNA helicase PIF1
MEPSLEALIEKVFPRITQNHEWLFERAILTPKNEEANKINDQIQLRLPGIAIKYKSIDTVTIEEQAVNFPTEFLNSLEPPGIPPHILNLKIGSPLMIIRNLNAPKLCNGTRVVIKNLTPNLIQATILAGKFKGEDILIPRIPMITNDLSFEFKRLQFPVRLAFAITINKSQGQTLKVAGLNLMEPCFSHGQLYVGCSRVGTPKNLFIYAPNNKTKNVVYPLALK